MFCVTVNFAFAAIFCFFAGSFLINLTKRPREADFAAIELFVRDRNLQVTRIIFHGDHFQYWATARYWQYWFKGLFVVGGLTRFAIIHAKSSDGAPHEIHTGFYDVSLSAPRQLKIILER